jgi:hypothetical protein
MLKAQPALGLLCCLLYPAPLHADTLDWDKLYKDGSKNVVMFIGEEQVKSGSDAMACINCHGVDAEGGGEGRRAAPPIAWRVLARKTNTRAAYTPLSLHDAITKGITPYGRPLSSLMPRYALSQTQVVGLVDYLKTLEQRQRSGIDPNKISITLTHEGLSSGVVDDLMRGFALATANKKPWGRSLELQTRSEQESYIQFTINQFAVSIDFLAGTTSEPRRLSLCGNLDDALSKIQQHEIQERRNKPRIYSVLPEQMISPTDIATSGIFHANNIASVPDSATKQHLFYVIGHSVGADITEKNLSASRSMRVDLCAVKVPDNLASASQALQIGYQIGAALVEAAASAGRNLTLNRLHRVLKRSPISQTERQLQFVGVGESRPSAIRILYQ